MDPTYNPNLSERENHRIDALIAEIHRLCDSESEEAE